MAGISVLPFFQLREAAADRPEEEKMATGMQESRGTKLKESNIDSLDSGVLGKEIEEEARENELEIDVQGPRPAEHDDGQPLKISRPEIPSHQPKQPYGKSQETTAGRSFLSFINGIGIIGSGVLAALFTTSQREKKALESTIDSMNTQIKDQEMATVLLKENLEARLLNEREEHQSQLKRLNNVEASLSSQLNSAKDSVATLGQELQDEKVLVEELKTQSSQLEQSFRQSREDKKLLEAALHEKSDRFTALQDKLSLLSSEINGKENNVQNLKSLLSERESECNNLCSTLEQAKVDFAAANFSIEQLKEDIFKTREESNSKGSIIENLQAKVKLLTEEKDDSNRKFSDLVKDYDDLISYTERTAVLNSELLSKKDEQLQQLEESLKHASGEVSCKQTTISELTKERDNLNALLDMEKNEIYKLTNELQSSRELLATSKVEVSHVSKELMEAKTAHEEVMSRILNLQDEFYRARQLLNCNLEEAKANSKIFSDELESMKVILCNTEEELFSSSNELKTINEEREGLKKELVDTYKRIEAMTNLLKEERKIVADLNKELEILREQNLEDSDSRKSLEADLDEATRSLDEMNRSALLLSRALENTNSRNSSLETEKEILYKSLIEQKNVAKEAHENIDDAKNVIARLGSEREKLEKRSRRFEEELAAAKGEILRLRRKIRTGQESMKELHSKSNEVPAGNPIPVKRNAGRRKKRPSVLDDSL